MFIWKNFQTYFTVFFLLVLNLELSAWSLVSLIIDRDDNDRFYMLDESILEIPTLNF